METQNSPFKYICQKCDYSCNKKSHFEQHLRTDKHKWKHLVTQNSPFSCPCGKAYKSRNGLWKHKKKCKAYDNSNNEDENKLKNKNTKINKKIPNDKQSDEQTQNELHEGILEKENKDLRNMVSTLMNKMSEQHKTIQELAPKVGNNCQVNINVFLNETCKDALNITDFIDSLRVGIKDLEFVKDNSLVDGVSSVFVKGLNKLEIEKRPIHCTDIKNKTLYIKDEDSWDNNNTVVKKSISEVKKKHVDAIKEWEEKHPNWGCDQKLTHDYLELTMKTTNDLNETEEEEIIEQISKEMDVKDVVERNK